MTTPIRTAVWANNIGGEDAAVAFIACRAAQGCYMHTIAAELGTTRDAIIGWRRRRALDRAELLDLGRTLLNEAERTDGGLLLQSYAPGFLLHDPPPLGGCAPDAKPLATLHKQLPCR